jgi:hypothetical protein
LRSERRKKICHMLSGSVDLAGLLHSCAVTSHFELNKNMNSRQRSPQATSTDQTQNKSNRSLVVIYGRESTEGLRASDKTADKRAWKPWHLQCETGQQKCGICDDCMQPVEQLRGFARLCFRTSTISPPDPPTLPAHLGCISSKKNQLWCCSQLHTLTKLKCARQRRLHTVAVHAASLSSRRLS